MRVLILLSLAIAASALPDGRARAGLLVAGFTPQRHDRFENDPAFVGAGFDWSGVGRSSDGWWGTLVSPSYAVSATHAPPAGVLRFYGSNDPTGPYLDRSIAAATQIVGSDLYLLRLAAPVPPESGIRSYEVAAFEGSSYLDREIYTFGLSNAAYGTQADQRLGRNQIDQVLPAFSDPALGATVGDVITYDYDAVSGYVPDESQVQSGDSGAPSFTIVAGQPALVGVHWFVYTADELTPLPGSGDTFVPSYIDDVNSAMLQLTPTGQPVETLRLAPIAAVPEPSSLTLSVAVMVLGAARLAAERQKKSCSRDV